MKTIIALVLAAAAVSANATPSASAVENLKRIEQQRQEAVEYGVDTISTEAGERIEASSKALNAPLKPATAEEVARVAKSREFRAAMRGEGVDMFAVLP